MSLIPRTRSSDAELAVLVNYNGSKVSDVMVRIDMSKGDDAKDAVHADFRERVAVVPPQV
jgi:hypothetical protein